jgi:hypothetical protein
MNTFKDLYQFLQKYNEDNIISWLKIPWQGKDKQESLLRLFAGLGLIDKLEKYNVCNGNFNLQTIKKNESLKDVFYKENNLIYLKDKGDSSDLTCILKKNNKHILVTTSKNLNKTNIGKLDIDKILTIFNKYDGFTMSLCICIRNMDDFKKMKIEETNKELKLIVNKEDTIIIDWNDLNQAYFQFKSIYKNKDIEVIMDLKKPTLCLKMHQELGVLKTIKMKNNGSKEILWGHIQRSGKSYIIGGTIIKDSQDKDNCNYLIITTAPNETINQQYNVLNCMQLEDFNIIILNSKNKKPKLTKKNIIICSKQFLQNKDDNIKITKTDKLRTIKKYLVKPKRTYNENEILEFILKYNINNDEIINDKPITSIKWLHELLFDMRFIDESHNGGTTYLAKKTLDFYGKNTFTIQITATYSKPVNDYNIPKNCWILWDLEDIKLCKNIKKEDLIKKHGEEMKYIIDKYSNENIINEYSKYPELWILTDEINSDIKDEIINNTKKNEYGWSSDACFLLKEGMENGNNIYIDEFQNEEENAKIWYKIFGKKDKYGISEYPDNKIFIKRIEKICKNPKINSRFMEEGSIIMAFLPQKNIDEISKATIKVLEKYNIIPDYEIVSINSKQTNNPKKIIEDMRIKAIHNGKKGVLVLSGKQCSLGVTMETCDIVLLLNNNKEFDLIYQMMFRCMSEGKNKSVGFVIDLNIHRVIETSIINYATLIKTNKHPKKAIKYILQERLINLNGDHWMPTFGNDISKIMTLCEDIYNIYSSNIEKALNHFLNHLRFKEIILTEDEQKIINTMFHNNKITKKTIKFEEDDTTENDNIKKGIEKTKVEGSDTSSEILSEKYNEKDIKYMEVLKHIIPLICLLTIHNEETSFIEMFNYIKEDTYIYNILIEQTRSWWGKNVNFTNIINIFVKYIKEDEEINQIIRTIKELFLKNINNKKELSNIIDTYLIPQELEKKTNAEVSTPFQLRKEMLNKIPIDFWKSIHKVFEPCSGKSGFILDIIDRFMNGLKEIIPNENERYKKIVEECLYFSDINATNIFISKLLINPSNKYNINYNEGDTLNLNIKEKWNIKGFDMVIGNPPYNSSGNTGTGNTIWQDFTKLSLNKWILKNGYLVYVHPPGWRKPNTEKGKYYGLYELMTKKNQMIYLSIHDIKDGLKTFKCGTRYDWYIIEKRINYKNTIINDEKGVLLEIDMNKFDWLPNYNINIIEKIITNNNSEKCEIIYNRSNYGSDKKNTSNKKNNEYKFPIVHTIPLSGVRYIYSNSNLNGHFHISKVIFGDNGLNDVIIDMEGEYGMSENSMAIKVDDIEEAQNIKKCLLSNNFKNFIKSCIIGNFRIDWRLFTYFRKDFWKEFI